MAAHAVKPRKAPERYEMSRFPGIHFVLASEYDALAIRVAKAVEIIEAADIRAEAADGPVNHVRDEMSDTEWRALYVALTEGG